MIGLLLRFVPFFGPLSVLFSFGRRVLHLKQEKIAHQAVGEPFPASAQAEIDNHSVRVQIAGWRLAAGVMTATTVGLGFLWYGATLKTQDAEHAEGMAIIEAKAARKERDIASQSYTNLKADYDRLVVLNSEASKNREGLIVAKTKAKVKRAVSDAKLPIDVVVDADSWLRIESAGGTASGVPASPVSEPGGVPAGAG